MSAPAATVIVEAVTDDANAPPIPYVPPDVPDAEFVPKCVTATVPDVENVNDDEFVFDPDDAAFHEHACRVYDPVAAFSFAPVVLGDAECSDA